MSDPISDFLNNSGFFPKVQELVFNRNFLGRNTMAIPYDEMPRQYREYLDDFAVSVLDPDGSKVIVTGNPIVGKTFLIEQLYVNREVFLKRSGQANIEFVTVSYEHTRLVENKLPGKWKTYAEATADVYQTDFADIVYVTESLDAAVGLSNLGGRVILELSFPTLHHLQKHESSGMVKQWASWEVIDLNDVLLTKKDMIELLSLSLLDKLNTNYPEIQMTKKHIALFVTYAAKQGDLVIDENMDEDRVGYICAQPGIFARAISRLASLMAISSEVRDKQGNIQFNRAMKRTFNDFEDHFFSCLQNFIERADEFDLDDPSIEDAIRNMMEDQLPPGVRIMSVQAHPSRRGKGEEPKKEELAFSDISTLEERLHKTVLGQNGAIKQVVQGLKVAAAGIQPPDRPRRSLLFLGPTGVGKTQLALSLGKELMSDELPVKRIDMSEYGHEHEAAKLIGAPPGYAGHDEGGVLTNHVSAHPTSIVILDEIEKAHPKVWDSFLQILDAGRLTDGRGKTVDFTNTIVIMTSNIGADKLSKPLAGFLPGTEQSRYLERTNQADKIVTKAVENTFRRELINRLDDQIIFSELPRDILRGVVAKELELVSSRIANRGYQLATPQVDILDYIANMADASIYGAREIQRVISRNIYELIADTILADNGEKALSLELEDGKLTVQEKEIGNTDGSES